MRAAVATLAVLFCTVAFWTSAAQAAEDTVWHKWVSKDHGIAAMFPGKATVTKQADGVQAALEHKGTGAYMLQVTDLGNKIDVSKEALVKQVFDGGQAGLVKAFAGSKVTSSDDFDLEDDVPARDIELDMGGEAACRVRLILDGERLYQVMVLGKKTFAEDDDADAFIHSFRFVEE